MDTVFNWVTLVAIVSVFMSIFAAVVGADRMVMLTQGIATAVLLVAATSILIASGRR